MRSAMPVLVALLTVAACSTPEETATEPESTPTATESTVEEAAETPTPTPTPEPTPDPEVSYTSSCDYVLGDFTESKSGYRFLADAEMKNEGNIGVVVELKGIWFLAGGDRVVETKEVRVPAGRSKRVGISVAVSGDQLDRHQSVDGDCKVKAAMIDMFGDVA